MTKRAIESTVVAVTLMLIACGGSSSRPLDGSSPPPIDGGSPPPIDGGSPPPIDGGSPPVVDGGSPPPIDGGSPPPIDGGDVLAAGNHRLSFSIDLSSTGLAVNGVDLTVQLPDGVQVATTADGSGRIAQTALLAGSAVGSGSLIVGRYLPNARQVRVSLTTPASAQWNGEVARLTIGVLTGTEITKASLLKTIGESFPAYRAVGLSTSTRGPVDLTTAVKVRAAFLD